MDCSFVVSVLFIVILLNTGLQTDGQVLTLCKDPLLSTRCTLQCSRRAANESVLLYKETSVKIECGEDNICSKPDAIHADSSNANSVKFHILKLEYADRANWTCKSGGRSGRTRELQVYSFKDENVAYDIRSMSSRIHNITVTVECVMPIPEIHVGFCDDQICRGQGKAFFNGPCAYPRTETHRQLNCIMDLNHRGARCNLKKEPIQISLIIDDRKVYSTKTNEVFSYGYAPKRPVITNFNCSRKPQEPRECPKCTFKQGYAPKRPVITNFNCSRKPQEPRECPKCTIKQDITGQCRGFNTAMTAVGGSFIGGCAVFVVYCIQDIIGSCCKKGYVKKSTKRKTEVTFLPEKRQKNKETSHDAEGKDDAGDQEAFDMETEV